MFIVKFYYKNHFTTANFDYEKTATMYAKDIHDKLNIDVRVVKVIEETILALSAIDNKAGEDKYKVEYRYDDNVEVILYDDFRPAILHAINANNLLKVSVVVSKTDKVILNLPALGQ